MSASEARRAARPSGALLTRRGRLADRGGARPLPARLGLRDARGVDARRRGRPRRRRRDGLRPRRACGPWSCRAASRAGRSRAPTSLVRLELQPSGGIVPPRAVVLEHVTGIGRRECEVLRVRGRLRGSYRLPAVPRGRYSLHGAALRVDDPFGLERGQAAARAGRRPLGVPAARRARQPVLGRRAARRPRPALPALARGRLRPARRARLPAGRVAAGRSLEDQRAPAQADGQGVRGHAARRVGRRARRGRRRPRSGRPPGLRVRDGRARGRIAAAAARARAASARACVVNALAPVHRSLATFESDWPDALELLAALRPNGQRPLCALLGERGAAVDAARVWVVTADLRPANAEAIAALAQARRDVAVVWVDAATWRDDPAPASGLGPRRRAAREPQRGARPRRPRRRPGPRAVVGRAP